ncbi:hypothetical protein ACEPAH_9552 [Sanghuangporus vaninii]
MNTTSLTRIQDPNLFQERFDAIMKRKSSPLLTTASELALGIPTWTKWSSHIGVFISGGHDPNVSAEIESFKKDVKYPLVLRALEATINVSEPNMANFVDSIKAWTGVDSTIRWTTASDASRLWEPLLNTW